MARSQRKRHRVARQGDDSKKRNQAAGLRTEGRGVEEVRKKVIRRKSWDRATCWRAWRNRTKYGKVKESKGWEGKNGEEGGEIARAGKEEWQSDEWECLKGEEGEV